MISTLIVSYLASTFDLTLTYFSLGKLNQSNVLNESDFNHQIISLRKI